jgi:RNA polymerase sigma factor (sigma-70 family)
MLIDVLLQGEEEGALETYEPLAPRNAQRVGGSSSGDGQARTLRPMEGFDDAAQLLRQLYPALLAIARSIAPDGEAEDLVQETLVRVLTSHPLFRELTHPVGYCKTVLMRLATRWRKARLHFLPISNEIAGRLNDSTSRAADRTLDSMILTGALTQLSPRQRVCVYLRYFEDLDDDAIAKILHCRLSTVRSQVSRGLKTLNVRLQGFQGGDAG